MKTNEPALLDSNVLIYAADRTSQFHANAKRLVRQGLRGNAPLHLATQVLLEFYAVITNPRRVTNPVSPQEAIQEIRRYISSPMKIVYPVEATMPKIVELARRYLVKGQIIFDLQLIATMLTNGITRIYTYNADHFRSFRELEVLTP
jgi:hypothetical protein